jgi:ribosome-associated translation inhibitor RaiA
MLAAGLLTLALHSFVRIRYSIPTDIGINLAGGALVSGGLATTAVAKAVKQLEKRLDRLESRGKVRNNDA